MFFLRKTVFILFIVFISLGCSHAQSDLQSWSSFSLSKIIKEKNRLIFKPIIRHRDNLSSFNNFSLDIIAKRKIDNHWSFSFLQRHWWLANDVNRNFWFIDAVYGFKANNNIKINQYFRWHIAQDIDINDPNFLRWHPSMTFNTSSKLKPYVGIEFFFRIDGVNEIQRLRSKVGASYVLSDRINLLLRLWREQFVNVTNARTDYVIQFNVDYRL